MTRSLLASFLLSWAGCGDAGLQPTLEPPGVAGPLPVSYAPTDAFLELDGEDDYVEVADDDALDLTGGAYTLEAWINPQSWGENAQGRILDHGGGSSETGWTFQLYNDQLMLQVNNAGLGWRSSPGAVALDAWQHVAVVVAGGTATFYVDGSARGAVAGVPAPAPASLPVRIGRRATDASRAFDGLIDEVRIWGRALSESELSAAMSGAAGGGDLLASYDLNDGAGSTATDGSGGGRHGRLFGSPTWHGGGGLAGGGSEPARPVLARVEVTPSSATLAPGGTLQFDAAGYDASGAALPITPVWSASGGSIDGEGLYTAPPSGRHTVTATAGGLAGSAVVTVEAAVSPEDPSTPPSRAVFLELDGADDFVEIAPAPALDLGGGSYTLEAWINPRGWGESSQGRILDHGGGSLPAGWTFQVVNTSFAQAALMLQVNNSGLSFHSSPSAVSLGRWQHVAVAVAGGTATFYVDGAPRGTVEGVPAPAPTDAPIRIGRRATDSARSFEGFVDEVRVWSRALSGAEISAGMTAPPPGGGLIAWYALDEGTGATAQDGSGSGFHGQIHGAAIWRGGSTEGGGEEPPPPTPVLTTLVVSPSSATLAGGATMRFSAVGYDQLGQPMSVTPTWSATGGSIDGSGVYTAPGVAGELTIAAKAGSVIGEARVTVEVAPPPEEPPTETPTGSYLELDGADDFIEVEGTAALDLADGEYTLEAWIHPHGWGESSQGRIVDHGGGSLSAGWTFQLNGSQLMLQVNNRGLNWRSADGVIALDTWQHVAVSVSGGVARFFVNGVENGVAVDVPAPLPAAAPVRIGRRATDLARAFDGYLDEVRIWSRALSQAEIREAMDAEPATHAGLLAEYDLNEGGGSTAHDSSGNGLHGVLFGSPVWHGGSAGGGETGGGGTEPPPLPPTPVLTRIVVSPASVTLAPGGTQQFSASGFDQNGESMPVSPQWSASGGAIDATGHYTAMVTGGQFTVTASSGGAAGSATVTVESAPEPPPPPPPPSGSDTPITGVSFDWSTHRRMAFGSDNWPVTWSDDGQQYTSWGDGGGFNGSNDDGRVSLGVGRIAGSSDSYAGINRFGGVSAECGADIDGKSYGLLSIGGVLYMWVSPGSGALGFERFTLYHSTDKGCTWSALPVTFSLAQHGIANGAFLNFGQDYAGARDGYVYTYAAGVRSTRDLVIQAPGDIFLMRVPIGSIANQGAYEFYSGSGPNDPSWSRDVSARRAVFHDPAGVSWNTGSVNHVPGLDRYVLITEHTASGLGNIQMHEAPEPWGPWTQILRESTWSPLEPSTFYWTIAPAWYRNGGVSFTLVFSGGLSNDSWNTVEGTFLTGGR